MKVSDIMSRGVYTIDRREPVVAAARLLRRMNLGALPVTGAGGRLVGMITDRDIAVRCVAAGADAGSLSVGEIMSRGVVTVPPDASVAEAAKLMGSGRVRRLPVVEDGRLVGVVSLADMARSCDMEAAAALADVSICVKRLTSEAD